jgi:hypothetical protein
MDRRLQSRSAAEQAEHGRQDNASIHRQSTGLVPAVATEIETRSDTENPIFGFTAGRCGRFS